jgi:hypothetical protein
MKSMHLNENMQSVSNWEERKSKNLRTWVSYVKCMGFEIRAKYVRQKANWFDQSHKLAEQMEMNIEFFL